MIISIVGIVVLLLLALLWIGLLSKVTQFTSHGLLSNI
jgi:hypothetical protein